MLFSLLSLICVPRTGVARWVVWLTLLLSRRSPACVALNAPLSVLLAFFDIAHRAP
jgi:hypothetical protein